MKKCKLIIFIFSLLTINVQSQISLTTLPSGDNKKAMVSEWVGLTEVKVVYNRPGVKGREGKIWGDLIHYGYIDFGFGSSKAAPWRVGANESTVISFSKDVLVEGKKLAAGRYGFFIAYDSTLCTIIFSKNSNSWGSYFYNEAEDALRIQVKTEKSSPSVERMKFEFTDQTEVAAKLVLSWENLQIPFLIQSNLIEDQLASFRNELRTERGFLWQSWDQAAQWCVQKNVNLEEALLWADSATSINFGGDKSFQAWTTKSQVLQKLNRQNEATELMKKILPKGSRTELHQYGRQLIGLKLYKDALDVFKMNYDKHPDTFTTLVGLARGYSANGDFNTALKYAQQSLPLAPDPGNKSNIENMITKLKDKKDIN